MQISAVQTRNIRLTVLALGGVMLLIVGMFVRQFINPERLDPEWLKMNGVILFDTPRSFDRLRLVDQQAAPFDGSAFSGAWSVLFFGFTYCPDVCPTTMTLLRDVEQALKSGSKDQVPVRFYFVSVDPARDTPQLLAPYVAHFSPQFTALTGEFLDVHRFATQMNIPFRKNVAQDGSYSVDHSANLVLINPRGHYAGFMTPPLKQQNLVRVLEVLRRHKI